MKSLLSLFYYAGTNTKTIIEAEEASEMWRTDLPGLSSVRNNSDLDIAELHYFEPYKLMKCSHMVPAMQAFYPITFVRQVLESEEKANALGDIFSEKVDSELLEAARISGSMDAYTRMNDEWKNIFQVIGHCQDTYRKEILKLKNINRGVDNNVLASIKTLENAYKSKNYYYGERQKFKADFTNVALIAHMKECCLFLDQYSNILDQTNELSLNSKGFKNKSETKNIIAKISKPKNVMLGVDHLKGWIRYLDEQTMKITMRADIQKTDYKSTLAEHSIQVKGIISRFIEPKVQDLLEQLVATTTDGLPFSIANKFIRFKKQYANFRSDKSVLEFVLSALTMASNQRILRDNEIYLHIAKQMYNYSIEIRKQKIEITGKEFQRIDSILRDGITVLTLLGAKDSQGQIFNPFIQLFKYYNEKHDTYIKGLEEQILDLEQGFDKIRLSRVDKARENIDVVIREAELAGGEMLNHINRFQLEISFLLFDLAMSLKNELFSSFNFVINLEIKEFDPEDYIFDEYATVIIPKINLMIGLLKKKYQQCNVANILDGENIITEEENIVINENENEEDIPDINHFSLADYENGPPYCPTEPSDFNNVSFIEKTKIVVGTFNTKWLFPFPYMIKDELRKYVAGSERKARRHFMRVVDVIAELNADILLLQEVQDCRVLRAIIGALNERGIDDYFAYLVENRDTATGQHIGFLTKYKPSEVEFLENGENGPATVTKNVFARFRFRNPSGIETSLDIIGVHLIAGEYVAKRNAQADFIADFAKRYSSDDSRLLIMGDMNDYDARVIGHKPYSQALDILSKANPKQTLVNAAKSFKKRNLQTQSTRGIVDHILGDQRLKLRRTKIRSDLVWLRTYDVSDHAPVTTEIYLFEPEIKKEDIDLEDLEDLEN